VLREYGPKFACLQKGANWFIEQNLQLCEIMEGELMSHVDNVPNGFLQNFDRINGAK
jgi:hypothetical protein